MALFEFSNYLDTLKLDLTDCAMILAEFQDDYKFYKDTHKLEDVLECMENDVPNNVKEYVDWEKVKRDISISWVFNHNGSVECLYNNSDDKFETTTNYLKRRGLSWFIMAELHRKMLQLGIQFYTDIVDEGDLWEHVTGEKLTEHTRKYADWDKFMGDMGKKWYVSEFGAFEEV